MLTRILPAVAFALLTTAAPAYAARSLPALAQDTAVSISALNPSSGPVGTQVMITGAGFTSDNTVRFGFGGAIHLPSSQNGTVIYFIIPNAVGPCSFVGNTSTTRCMAPAMLVHSGTYPISVETAPSQSSNSMSFKVTD
jgi:hypothetical protein